VKHAIHTIARLREFVVWLIAVGLSTPLLIGDGGLAVAQSDNLPRRDPESLARRFMGVESPGQISPSVSGAVGDRRAFYVLNQANSSYLQVDATLAYISPHAHWWVQDGVPVESGALERSAATLESAALPALQSVYGVPSPPANATDQRIHILNARTQGIGAYFSSVDALTRSVHPYSNELPLIVVNVSAFFPGTSAYNETLAHELQHLFHWGTSPASETWFDEGVSEVVASAIRGSPSRGASYAQNPDRSLIAWTDDPGAFSGQYDGSYLFAQYLADRFGRDALGGITRLGRAPPSVEAFIAGLGHDLHFDEIFGDWLAANLKDNRRAERPRPYRYEAADPEAALAGRIESGSDLTGSVTQFGADYLEVAPGTSSFHIHPAATVRIAPASGPEDNLVWWSNRADSLDATLTRRIDLRAAATASLGFRTWFNTEREFDHGYVAVSRDDGATWTALPGLHTVAENRTGNAYGPSFTGRSGDERDAHWVDEQVDLSPYIGQEVLVRFEYITDQGTTQQGWLIDDISIEAAGVSKEDEEDQSGWQAEGFVRTPLGVPSRMMAQVISGSGATTAVTRYWVEGGAEAEIPVQRSEGGRAVVTVSGVTPMTVEPMEYRIRAVP
jgi:hypothetical protein